MKPTHATPDHALAAAELLEAWALRIRRGQPAGELGREIRLLGTILERKI